MHEAKSKNLELGIQQNWKSCSLQFFFCVLLAQIFVSPDFDTRKQLEEKNVDTSYHYTVKKSLTVQIAPVKKAWNTHPLFPHALFLPTKVSFAVGRTINRICGVQFSINST